MKPKRGTFKIATREGFEDVIGWVLGDFAARKERYFWEFTDLAHGMKLSTYPCIESKAAAFEHLAKLNDQSTTEAQKAAEARALVAKRGAA